MLLGFLTMATVAAAECWGPREMIYCGAAGGGQLGLIGFLFAVRIASAHKKSSHQMLGRWDIWAVWLGGFLIRLILLGVLCWLFGSLYGSKFQPALNSMAAVYLTLHFWEIFWLFRIFTAQGSANGVKHG